MNAPIEGIALAIVIVGLALSTFVTRTSFLAAGARGRLHPRVETALRYAPVCTLTAIIVPDVLMHAQHADFSLLNPRLVGVLAVRPVAHVLAQHLRLPGRGHGRLSRCCGWRSSLT